MKKPQGKVIHHHHHRFVHPSRAFRPVGGADTHIRSRVVQLAPSATCDGLVVAPGIRTKSLSTSLHMAVSDDDHDERRRLWRGGGRLWRGGVRLRPRRELRGLLREGRRAARESESQPAGHVHRPDADRRPDVPRVIVEGCCWRQDERCAGGRGQRVGVHFRFDLGSAGAAGQALRSKLYPSTSTHTWIECVARSPVLLRKSCDTLVQKYKAV